MLGKENIEMTCSCGKEITAPQLTGELCIFCFGKKGKEKTNDNISILGSVITSMDSSSNSNEASILETEYTCPECNEQHPIPDSGKERICLVQHNPSKSNEVKQEGVKYCQSCIERGYGLRPATREFPKVGEWICEECLEPMLNNVFHGPITNQEINRIKDLPPASGPLLTQAYDLLNIPKELRFVESEKILRNRNDIFNYHASANINMSLEELAAYISEREVLLFQIKLSLEASTGLIDKLKREEREKKGLSGLEKSQKEYSKGHGSTKVKLSRDQKEADILFKHKSPDSAVRLKMYQEMNKIATVREFKKVTGT